MAERREGWVAGRQGRIRHLASMAELVQAPLQEVDVSDPEAAVTCETHPSQHGNELPLPARRRGLVQIFPCRVDAVASTFHVSSAQVIGRSSQAQIHLLDTRVSRQHARVESHTGGLLIQDLGSRHGTFVNGLPVGSEGSRAPIGSLVRAGDTLFLVVDDVSRYAHPPHRLSASFLDTAEDAIAGPTLLSTWNDACQAATLRHPVLISGESGAGKEVIARIIHGGQKRRVPFVAVNVAAVPEALFESELFGHARGAFTGATSERTGAFRDAADGVLFLDEVGELRLDLQVKLLRAIDQMRVRPVGGREEYPVCARVVAASNVDLREAAAKGLFRLDLYHRLAGILIHVPPLRERRDEIPPLSLALLSRQQPQLALSADAAERLALGHWAGNVRELAHALGQASLKALSMGRTELGCSDLPDSTQVEAHTSPTAERVQQVMRSTGGNATRAARALGISRATLYNLLRRWGLNPGDLRARA